MPKQAPQVALTPDQVAIIQTWEQAKAALDGAKSAELAGRLSVIEHVPFGEKEEGGQTVRLGAGWRLALERRMIYTVEDDKQKINAALLELFAIDPDAVQTIIKWKPVLNETVYKKLSDEAKKLLAEIVTMKPGTPSLELKPPATPKG